MNFDFSEEQNLLIDTTKAFVKEELLQHEELLEKTNNLPKELYDEIKKKSIEAGLYACNMPVEHGGGGSPNGPGKKWNVDNRNRHESIQQSGTKGGDDGKCKQ